VQRGMIGARDTKEMRSNRCVRFIENRDDIKRNRNTDKIRIHIKTGNRDKKNKYIEIKNIL
jgi:hypothetical protein